MTISKEEVIQLEKFGSILLSAIVAFVLFVQMAILITSPFVSLDEKRRRIVAPFLGYISMVSLSSIMIAVILTVAIMESIKYYFGDNLSLLNDIKSILLWISGASGVFAVLGALEAALIPVVWWQRVNYKDVGLYTGSALLSLSAAGGVVGILFGLISAPYRVEFFGEDSFPENDGAWLEKSFNALGPGAIFLGVSCVFHFLGIDAVHNFYRFGNDLLVSEGVNNCHQSASADISVAVACATQDLAGSEVVITYMYYVAIIVTMLACAIYRYVKSGEVTRLVRSVRKLVSDLRGYKRSQ